MLNLSRFTKLRKAVVPIIAGSGVAYGRKIRAAVDDGWYSVELGNSIQIKGPASLLEVDEEISKYKKYKGYPFGAEVVPINFQNLFQMGSGNSVPVYFLESPPWDIVSFFRHPDGRFYSAGPDLSSNRDLIGTLEKAFVQEKSIKDIKGITPELRYYFILLSLQRQSFRDLEQLKKMNLQKEERDRRMKEFQNTFAGRLKKTIEDTGAKLVSFQPYGKDKFEVAWRVGGQTIKSVVNGEFKIYELGFCAVDDWRHHRAQDKKYFLQSAIMLAQTFQEDSGDVYILRD